MLAIASALGLLSSAIQLTGVELYSNQTTRYGRWEFRMKAAATPGTVSSFFTYYNNSYLDSPYPWREIDIEVLGKNGKAFQSNLITGTASDKSTSEKLHSFASDLSQTYHTYTLDWTPDSVVWRLDGALVRKTAAPDQQVVDLSDSAQTWRMNLWASTTASWAGALDTTKLPVLQIVHWMRYSNYTPGAGTDGSNFTLAWVDSFKTLNRTRWSLGNWTFDGNYATFSATNATVVDGHLVMMLSTNATAGQFPATFLHASASASVRRSGAKVATAPSRMSRSTWRIPGAGSADVFDLRGVRVATSRRVEGGVEFDLGRHTGMAVVRSGDQVWRILSN